MKLEIFKVGKHTSSNGITKDYTLEDLNGIVTNHSEPTPIVVGHPKTDSPAFGWIKSLFVKGDSLFAEASDIVPEFLELVKQKIYPNRSASFSTNEDGTLQLKHIGFLGGTLPAVKGLEAIQFNADEELNTFEFALAIELSEMPSADGEEQNKTEVSQDSNPKVSPFPRGTEGGSDNFAESILELKGEMKKVVEFMESIQTPQGTVDTSDIQSKIDELNLKIDAAYFQRNISEKMQMDNLTPAIKNKILNLLSYFESLEFSVEDNNKVISDFQELVELIQPFQTEEILKKVEFTKKVKDAPSEFSEMNVDKDSLKLFNEATEYAKENEITFADAVTFLINKDSEV